jgi:ribosomal protein S18 acetylase RimI-like enzyme
MTGSKLLLDANIFIPMEDPTVVSPSVAALAQKAHLHGISLYLDEACIDDVKRDPKLERREATLSKLKKFPVLDHVAHRSSADQLSRFGSINTDNDRCDVLMLDTLDLGVVDFLITEDTRIHSRADRAGLRDRVLTVQEALVWVQRTFEPKEFRLRFIASRKAHQVSTDDPLFVGLRQDYPGFDDWFAKCRREHRDCWTVEIDGQLAGLVIRKDEAHAEAQTVHKGPKILKVCTLKMKPSYYGEKFGEQLLKKILWFAQGNRYDLIYLTVFPKHGVLITLLQTFGFEITDKRPNGELVMERPMLADASAAIAAAGECALALDLRVYPRFYDGPDVRKYVIPIKPEFHAVLFPEIAEARELLPLFPELGLIATSKGVQDRTPGNTVRKVYVCRSPTRALAAGDVLLFYLSKTDDFRRSQSVTTVGIVEQARLATSTEELMRRVGRRSVYSRKTLEGMSPAPLSPVLVIDFLLNGHLNPVIPLHRLLTSGVFVGGPPQSIKCVGDNIYRTLKIASQVRFE